MRIGVYNRWLDTLGGGERYMLAVALAWAEDAEVTVISTRPVSPETITQRLHLDMRHVRFECWPDWPDDALAKRSSAFDLFINASHMSAMLPHATKNALMVYFPSWSGREWWQPLLSWLAHYMAHPLQRRQTFRALCNRILPGSSDRLFRVPPPQFKRALERYDLICAISRFSQQWIEQYWGLPSAVLYPPVDIGELFPLEKRNMILSVGRFFVGGHNKKQLEMVRTFKKMCDEGLADWELHLAGGASDVLRHQQYLALVRAEAQGYPVQFHLDASFETLRMLYGQAQVYWHASGADEDIDRHPDRFEHFGITTVEAMAAGCVPVVIGKAGQREVVTHGKNGLLWETWDECLEHTWNLIRSPQLMADLSEKALARSRDFGFEAFKKTLNRLVKDFESWHL